jgi:hypothetical protein
VPNIRLRLNTVFAVSSDDGFCRLPKGIVTLHSQYIRNGPTPSVRTVNGFRDRRFGVVSGTFWGTNSYHATSDSFYLVFSSLFTDDPV